MGLAVLLAVAAALPAVWWEPLHVDEAVTLEFASESVPAIFQDVFVERGGAPFHFLLEHLSLQWPGGLAGLRLPSVLFFLAAVVLSAPVARELIGGQAALLLPPLLALAPLGVRLSTFARMYTLFLAGVLLSVWLLLRAARGLERMDWIIAGVVTGGLVYVHPIAPLYISVALVTAYLHSNDSLQRFVRNARPGLASGALVAAPYAYALAVLRARYDVGSASRPLFESASGRTVPEEILLALGSGAWVGTGFLVALATVGLVTELKRSRRTGVALALWILVPLVFFSVVPSDTAFFPRYLLPALPFFLLLVVLGCLTVGRFVRRPLLVASALVLAILVWEAIGTASRLERLRDLRLARASDAIAEIEDPVLFSSTGRAVAGRPGELLDAYLALEQPDAERVEELPAADPGYTTDIEALGVAAVKEFLGEPHDRQRGVWIFTGPPRRLDQAARRFERRPELEVRRISRDILLVRSRTALDSRSLLEQALVVRSAWLGVDGRDRWSQILMRIDREALAADR